MGSIKVQSTPIPSAFQANGTIKAVGVDTPLEAKYNNYGFPMLKDFEVAFCELEKPDVHPEKTQYEGGPKPSKTVLPAGHVKPTGFGCRPLPCDMHYERDVQIAMRDGTKIYIDVYRPVVETPLPTIVAWSPYGKSGTGDMTYDKTGPYNCGIDPKSVSGYHQFEAPDPAEWAHRGYAMVNVDARGAFDSDGNMMRWGPQEALDVYDTIQWITEQLWSSGSVTMAGNSWLAVSQINAASRCPHPALKCIAPWEGHSDHYKDVMVRGGIPQVAFGNWMQSTLVGRNKMEDTAAMAKKHPYHDEYWKVKAIPVANIAIPTYIVASYSSFIHTAGSIRTWRESKTDKKWLRFHNGQEWSDLYQKRNVDDLQKFYDFYLKGVDNGWESTSPVRLSLISFHGKEHDVVERSEPEYPLTRQRLVRLHLDAQSTSMGVKSLEKASEKSYEGHHLTDCLDFEWKADKYTEIAGFPCVKLWVSCREKSDMDIRVQLRKKDASGKLLAHRNFYQQDGGDKVLTCVGQDKGIYAFEEVNIHKFLGSTGMLRASHAVSYNESKSTENEPFYEHDRALPISPGTVVPLRIGFWPTGMTLNEGESLVLRVAGHSLVLPEFKVMTPDRPIDFNEGRHTVHTGGKYDSHLIVPIINY